MAGVCGGTCPRPMVRSSSQMRDRPDRLAGAACPGDLAIWEGSSMVVNLLPGKDLFFDTT